MKTKFNLLFVMLLSSLCITFTSCSDDDDDKKDDYAKEIAGTYKGDVFLAETEVATDATITITRNETDKVTLKMDETIEVEGTNEKLPINVQLDSDVTYSSDKYHIAGTTTFEMNGVTLPVTISGSIDKSGNATINIEITAVGISVVYEGKKQ